MLAIDFSGIISKFAEQLLFQNHPMRIGLLPPDLSGTSIDQVISMEEVLRNARTICQIFKLPMMIASISSIASPTQDKTEIYRVKGGKRGKFDSISDFHKTLWKEQRDNLIIWQYLKLGMFG